MKAFQNHSFLLWFFLFGTEKTWKTICLTTHLWIIICIALHKETKTLTQKYKHIVNNLAWKIISNFKFSSSLLKECSILSLPFSRTRSKPININLIIWLTVIMASYKCILSFVKKRLTKSGLRIHEIKWRAR